MKRIFCENLHQYFFKFTIKRNFYKKRFTILNLLKKKSAKNDFKKKIFQKFVVKRKFCKNLT